MEIGKTAGDPFWILVNQLDSFKIIAQNQNGNGSKSPQDSDDIGNGYPKQLIIDKKFCKIYEKNCSADEERRGIQNTISALLGILNISGQNFLVVVTEKQYVAKIDGANIYLVKNADLIAFYDDFQAQTQIKNYVEGVKKLLTQGFYFSYNTDLTSNRQRTAKMRADNPMGGDGQSIFDTCDKRYFWNYNMCQDFVFQKTDPRWIVPVIQGYIEYSSQLFDGKEIEILLISRRRHGMAGTRYNARGLDDEGNVANFVESEQILCYRNHVYSFTQIRGSVPLFWQQKGLQAHTSIKRENELTLQAFDKHLSEMVNDYRLVIFINLLQKARSYEYMLTEALEQLFQMLQPKCVKYTYFDFHTETKGDNFQRLNDLLTKIEDMLVNKFVYFVEDRHTGKILQEQKGVMRTNCLDCLDRTNVTQTKIALKILENILDRIKGANRKGMNAEATNQLNMYGFNEMNDAHLFEIAKNMWAENGDVISKQYAGTGSTITSVTKTGKQGFMGKIDQMRRGVERFLVNNIEDGHKHECIKLIINQHPQQQQYGIRASLEKQIEKYQSHFMSWSDIKVNIVSWNCAGNTPPKTFDLTNILFSEKDQQKLPDIYIIGLQEMVKLNAKSVIQGKDKERVIIWEDIVKRTLCKKSKYVCVSKKPMVGCLIMLFTKVDHKYRINSIRTSKVKTGFGGQSGNKGSVAIRFNFDNSSFAFINCHLTSGQSKVSERLEDIREIYKKSFDCSQKYQDFMIQSHDYKFIFGDLNFRIALPYENVKDEIRQKNYKYLQSKDQLLQSKQSNSILSTFNEGQLNFDPTYKYDDHSVSYDTSQKKRIPAWCDRILYEKSQKCGGLIDLIDYGRRESFLSDHRPVYSNFNVKVCLVDQKKRQEIEAKLVDTLFPGQKKQQVQQVQNQFNLMSINIQEGYLDNNSIPLKKEFSDCFGSSTSAVDSLLGDNSKLTESQAIDELLKSNMQSSQSDDLINLSPQQFQDMLLGFNDKKSSDDLIDLAFGSDNSQQHQRMHSQQPQQQMLQGVQHNQVRQMNSFNTQPINPSMQPFDSQQFSIKNSYFQFTSQQQPQQIPQQQQQLPQFNTQQAQFVNVNPQTFFNLQQMSTNTTSNNMGSNNNQQWTQVQSSSKIQEASGKELFDELFS